MILPLSEYRIVIKRVAAWEWEYQVEMLREGAPTWRFSDTGRAMTQRRAIKKARRRIPITTIITQ